MLDLDFVVEPQLNCPPSVVLTAALFPVLINLGLVKPEHARMCAHIHTCTRTHSHIHKHTPHIIVIGLILYI